MISEADKFDEVKNATAAIGLANIDTKDVIAGFWYGTDFFVRGEYIVISAYILVNVLSITTSIRIRIGVWKECIPHSTLPQKEIS